VRPAQAVGPVQDNRSPMWTANPPARVHNFLPSAAWIIQIGSRTRRQQQGNDGSVSHSWVILAPASICEHWIPPRTGR
jgi:hypothetical protein